MNSGVDLQVTPPIPCCYFLTQPGDMKLYQEPAWMRVLEDPWFPLMFPRKQPGILTTVGPHLRKGPRRQLRPPQVSGSLDKEVREQVTASDS